MIKKLKKISVYLFAFIVLSMLCRADDIDSFIGNAGAGVGDGIFSQVFGNDFNISGGTLNYLPGSKAVLIRNYATLTVKGRRIRARNIVFFTDTNKIYAEGDVSVEDPRGAFLNCEQLYFDINDWKGRARKIRLRNDDNTTNTNESVEEKDVSLSRPSLAQSQSGLSGTDSSRKLGAKASPVKMRMNLTASDMRMVSQDHYEATNVTASPSNYARPHWSISSKAVQIRRNEKVEAYHNFIKIGKVPVFYLPYLIYDLQYDWPFYRTSVGYNNKQGYYWLNRIGWKFKNPEFDKDGNKIQRFAQIDDIYLDADIRTNRGYGLGGETNYSVKGIGQGGSGHFQGYWINEIYTTSGQDLRRANEDNEFKGNDWYGNPNYSRDLYANKNRYMLEWWHTQNLTEEIDLRAQVHRYSDRDFQKDYFWKEWTEHREQKTNATLRYLNDKFVTEIITQGRINEFESGTDYMPEWRANLPGFQLFNLPLYVESETRAGLLRYRYDETLSDLAYYDRSLIGKKDRVNADGHTPWIGRVYNKTELAAAFDLGFVNISPHAGGFLAGYSEGYDDNFGSTKDGKFNGAAIWGIDFSNRFFGYFDKFRHMIEPTVNIIGHETPATNRADLYHLDDLDDYRKSHVVDFGLYQQLDTKSDDGTTRKLAHMTLKSGVILDEKEAREFNNNRIVKDVTLDGAVYPLESMSMFGDITYAPAGDQVTDATIGLDYWFSSKFRAYLAHDYDSGYDREKDENNNESNVTTAAFRTQLWNKHSRYSFEYAMSYQWNGETESYLGSDGIWHSARDDKGLQSQKFTLIRDLDTFELSANFYINHIDNNNFTFSINLTPKGWLGIEREPTGTNIGALDDNYGRYSHPVPEKMKLDDPGYDADTPAWE